VFEVPVLCATDKRPCPCGNVISSSSSPLLC
jgi:hypothetical protein